MASADDIRIYLQLYGQAAFQRGMRTAAASVDQLERAASGRSLNALDARMASARTALAGVGRVAGNAALAVAALGTAGAVVGVKYNATMEQANVAFTNLLGSQSKAQTMLDQLFRLAAETPFEFPSLVKGSQRLLGFGLEAKALLPTMTTIGDAVAGVGGGEEEINRIVRALGQMQAKGRISSEELMQMAEAGVPAMKILADEMGITGEQLTKRLKKGTVDADKGIGALTNGMRKRYGGMAKDQSKTFNGMVSNVKDTGRQALGA